MQIIKQLTNAGTMYIHVYFLFTCCTWKNVVPYIIHKFVSNLKYLLVIFDLGSPESMLWLDTL